MSNFLRNFDRLSFWLGFIGGALFWLLIGRLWPMARSLLARLKVQQQASRQQRSMGDEIRLSNDAMRRAQGWHLAAPLFSLDEIALPPRFLAPAVPPMAYEPPPSEDITDWAVPYMLDWPELGSYYGAPWLSLAEALRGGTNLVITGQPGTGKTVALAYLVAQISHQDPEAAHLAEFAPILIHAADLSLPQEKPEAPLNCLRIAISRYVTSIPAKRLPTVLHNLCKQGRILLLVDGLDEFPLPQIDPILNYLQTLLKDYPGVRLVITSAPEHLGKALSYGYQPLPIALWNQGQRALFLSRWSDLWNRFIVDAKASATKSLAPDPMLLVGWLLNNTTNLNPLELTLKTWAAFAGDSLGPSALSSIEAYLRRMMIGQPGRNRPALEQMASQLVLGTQPLVEQRSAENWLGGSDLAAVESTTTAPESADPSGASPAAAAGKPVRARGALSDLVDCGLIVLHPGERVRLVHPTFTGYLAAMALAQVQGGTQLTPQPVWTGKLTTLNYLAIIEGQPVWIYELLKGEDADPTLRGLLNAGRWLRIAPDGQPWTSAMMRQLSGAIQKENLTLGLKARLLSALLVSNNPSLAVLLRMLLEIPQPELRQLATLGLGFVRDAKATVDLSRLVKDTNPGVSRAAILALTAIGDRNSLEAVASALLQSDESLQRAAAEALANHIEEGHPTLEDASSVQDPRVRRAAVFGLGRTRQAWAIKILEKLRAEDAQWVVQDAANQVLAISEQVNPRLPRSLPALPQTAWLIAFAAERGMGVAPGKPAYEMLYRALREGSEDQKMAALYFLAYNPEESSILPLYQTYYSSAGEIRSASFEALIGVASTGIDLPAPTQYGLK
jgi:HEAT repeat protein